MIQKFRSYVLFILLFVSSNQLIYGMQSKTEDKAAVPTKQVKKPWYKSMWAKAGAGLTLLGATAVTMFYIGRRSGEKDTLKQAGLYPRLYKDLEEGRQLAGILSDLDISKNVVRKEIQQWINQGHDIDRDVIDYQSLTYFTPLMVAARSGNVDALEILVQEFHANVNKENTENFTPLMIASARGETSAMAFLIKNNAKVNAESSGGRTPLLLSVMHNNYPEPVKLLLKNNAQVNVTDLEGCTPLMIAYLKYVDESKDEYQLESRMKDLYKIMKILLVGGAKIDVTIPAEGRSLIDDAHHNKLNNIVELFEKYK